MMYILALTGHEKEGAYAIDQDNNKRMVYMFLDKDDAVRYAGLLAVSYTHLTLPTILLV